MSARDVLRGVMFCAADFREPPEPKYPMEKRSFDKHQRNTRAAFARVGTAGLEFPEWDGMTWPPPPVVKKRGA